MRSLIYLDSPALSSARDRLREGDPTLAKAADRLRAEAEAALPLGPWSVTDKSYSPPSGDKHDYMSMSSYVWPNPDTPDGLPYVMRDGLRNPECDEYDEVGLVAMRSAAETLALAAYLFGEPSYAERAAHLLRIWFLDPATRMNPHLEFGQAVPGVAPGHRRGIIDLSTNLPPLLDAGILLREMGAWSDEDDSAWERWLDAQFDWLIGSEFGAIEAEVQNNHGMHYDVLVLGMALRLGHGGVARLVAGQARGRRVWRQIAPDGMLPREAERTRGMSYTAFNLNGLLTLAHLAAQVGIDLYQYEAEDGRMIRKAIDAFLPYALGEQPWPREQILPFEYERMVPVLLKAAHAYSDRRYLDALGRLPVDVKGERAMLLYPAKGAWRVSGRGL
jgi:hypothetical protein